MPLNYSERHPEFGQLHLWRTEEDISFFEDYLKIDPVKLDQINSWTPDRKKEWLAARFVLKKYYNVAVHETRVDDLGKVHLTTNQKQISISHSGQLVGVQINDSAIGLDIQVKSSKIHRVAKKFCSEKDYEIFASYYPKEDSELFLWSLKESVFKAYGKGRVRYKEEVITERFVNKNLVIMKLLRKNEEDQLYLGRLRMIGDFCLTQVIEHSDQESRE